MTKTTPTPADRITISRDTLQQLYDGLDYCIRGIRAIDPPLKIEDMDYLNELLELLDELKGKLRQ